jgi:hypothetical protein
LTGLATAGYIARVKWGLGLVAGALTVGLGFVSPAGAATTLYAKPSGGATSGTCGPAAPCTLAYAATKLSGGNTLKLLPGKYPVPNLGSSCANPDGGLGITNSTVEGISGLPRPTLDETTNHCGIGVGTGGVLRDVTVLEPTCNACLQGLPLIIADGGTADGIVDPGTGYGAFVDGSSTVENSFINLIVFQDSGGVAINDTAGEIDVRGVTAPDQNNNLKNFNAAATVVNTIAKKFRAYNLRFDSTTPPTSTATMTLSYYAGVTDSSAPDGHGQFGSSGGTINASNKVVSDATPLNLAADGLHETEASPTVDAGTQSSNPQLPATDYDNGNRALGAPDVGADEYLSGLPTLQTISATNITSKSATLRGTINTNEIDNPSVQFLYGKGASRTLHTTPHDAPPSTATVLEQATVTGLTPDTTYSFVIESGSRPAQVVTFHTPKPPNPFKGVVFEQKSAQANAKHVVALKMFCPANTIGFCKGSLTFKLGTTVLGASTFLANHGNLFTVHVTLTKTAFRQLVSKRSEIVLATAAAHDANGNKKNTAERLTLKAPPK